MESTKIILEKNLNGRTIVLRSPQISDAEHLAEYWFGPASAHLLPYTDTSLFGSRDDYLARIQNSFRSAGSDGPLSTLVGDVDGQPSGTVLINGLIPNEEALVHVHIWNPSLRRTGIGSHMAQEALDYFLTSFALKRLILQVPSENLPVIHLLDSLGLEAEGTYFGKAAPVCKEGNYRRYILTQETIANLRLKASRVP